MPGVRHFQTSASERTRHRGFRRREPGLHMRLSELAIEVGGSAGTRIDTACSG
jgi:hypothetical protein